MEHSITNKEGIFYINGKRFSELNIDERTFLNDFFREYKQGLEVDKLHQIAYGK